MVSHTRVKTPTAAAALLIDHLKQVLDTINNSQNSITRSVQQKLSTLNAQLSSVSEAIPRLFSIVKTRQEARLDALGQKIPMLIERRLTNACHHLEIIEERIKSLDPQLLLKRGYSITLHNGKAVRDPQELHQGDEIETRLEKGTLKSIIK